MPYANPISGIYIITNTYNNKKLIGYSYNMIKRLKRHRRDLINQVHRNGHLQKAWNKYGEGAFLFETLEEYPIEILSAMEHYWCLLLDTHNRKLGYNILPTHPYMQNSGHSEETKKLLSQKNTGYRHTKQAKRKMSLARKGGKQTEEWVEKRACQRRGTTYSAEICKNMSNGRKKRGIKQYSLEGGYIREWLNMQEVIDNTGFNPSGIYKCLNQESKKSNGFRWKYK